MITLQDLWNKRMELSARHMAEIAIVDQLINEEERKERTAATVTLGSHQTETAVATITTSPPPPPPVTKAAPAPAKAKPVPIVIGRKKRNPFNGRGQQPVTSSQPRVTDVILDITSKWSGSWPMETIVSAVTNQGTYTVKAVRDAIWRLVEKGAIERQGTQRNTLYSRAKTVNQAYQEFRDTMPQPAEAS